MLRPIADCLHLQAGLFLWQQLLPKKAAAQREELLKLDIAGVSLTRIACCQCPLVRGQQSHQHANLHSSYLDCAL